MKKLLLFATLIVSGMISFSQAISTPDINQQQIKSQVPNLQQSAQNLIQSTLFVDPTLTEVCQASPTLNENTPSRQQSPNLAKTAYLTNLNGKAMQAYPNPVIDQVTIQYVSSAQRAVLSVVSTDGRVLQQQTVMPNTLQTELHLGRLNKGMYILRFDDSKGDVRTIQLLKN